MIETILALLVASGSFCIAILFVMYKQAKQNSESGKIEKTVSQSVARQKKENEELVQKTHADNTVDSFNAGIELLRQQAQKGKQRNSGS